MAWGKAGDISPKGGSAGSMSFIGNEVRIVGNISAGGVVHIDGTVDGDVSCAQVMLGASGTINGNITSDRATLAGTVKGSISAGELIVEKSAQLSGDLCYDTVTIENGAKVDGRLSLRETNVGGELKLVSVVND